VRMRRDFTQLLTMIQAHAVLYPRQRERANDSRIIAMLSDYQAVYDLIAPIFQAVASDGITPQVRQTVEAVQTLTSQPDDTATVLRVGQHIKIDKSAASRRVKRAVDAGFLVNLEDKQERPLKLRIGDSLPDQKAAPPKPEDVWPFLPRNRATAFPACGHRKWGYGCTVAQG
jgi:hypothetical protein